MKCDFIFRSSCTISLFNKTGKTCVNKDLSLIDHSGGIDRIRVNKAFTLIELLVVISIIALLSSVVMSTVIKARVRARDSQRIQNARQIAIALEQYEATNNTYKVANAGLNNGGGGYVSKGAGDAGYTNSVLSVLKSSGMYSSVNLKDPVYGTDNYYLGICPTTNAYNIFVKMEQSQYNSSSSSIVGACGGDEAVAQGFNYIASTAGGSSGGGGSDSGFIGVSESIASLGSLDSTFNPGTGPNADIRSVAVQSDGKIVIVGTFNTYNGNSRNHIARLNADGTLDTTFNPGTGADGLIRFVTLQSDGKILIAGDFTNYNSTAVNRIARINTNGSLDSSFATGGGANDTVNGMVIQSDGKIVAVGNFTSFNGNTRNRIVRLTTLGADDGFVISSGGFNDNVYSISIQPDGKMYPIGWYGNPTEDISRIDSNGTVEYAFAPNWGLNSYPVYSVIQSDGKIIIAGAFTNYYDGVTFPNHIVRINTNGTVDSSYNIGTGTDNDVKVIFMQPDGKVVIGGDFTTYNSISRIGIARINTDGSLDTTLNPGTGANGTVYAIARQPNGKLIIAGGFSSYNGTPRSYIARIQ